MRYFINEAIPVGSKGILYEAQTIAEGSHLKLRLAQQLKVDVGKSAGPSTVILASLPKHQLPNVHDKISKPINIIGQLL